MIDLSMQYLGLKLSGPIVVSSTPLSESIDNVRRMEDAGASAIVLTSLFEEQLALESRALDEDLSRGTDSFAESLGYLPDLDDYRMTHEVYLEASAPRQARPSPFPSWPASTAPPPAAGCASQRRWNRPAPTPSN